MHTTSFLGALVFALALLTSSSASALYCSQRIVREGDMTEYVRSLCGEPTSAISRVESRSQVVYVRGGIGAVYSATVQIDTWVYDFGSNRFMIELIFENGILGSERTLGYGTAGRRSAARDVRGAPLRLSAADTGVPVGDAPRSAKTAPV